MIMISEARAFRKKNIYVKRASASRDTFFGAGSFNSGSYAYKFDIQIEETIPHAELFGFDDSLRFDEMIAKMRIFATFATET